MHIFTPHLQYSASTQLMHVFVNNSICFTASQPTLAAGTVALGAALIGIPAVLEAPKSGPTPTTSPSSLGVKVMDSSKSANTETLAEQEARAIAMKQRELQEIRAREVQEQERIAAAERRREAAERFEQERIAAAKKAEAERLEQERIAAAEKRAEVERLEQERIAAERRAEAARAEAARIEQESLAAERRAEEARTQAEREKAEAARIEAQRIEQERIAAEKRAEAARIETQRIERERAMERQRIEAGQNSDASIPPSQSSWFDLNAEKEAAERALAVFAEQKLQNAGDSFSPGAAYRTGDVKLDISQIAVPGVAVLSAAIGTLAAFAKKNTDDAVEVAGDLNSTTANTTASGLTGRGNVTSSPFLTSNAPLTSTPASNADIKQAPGKATPSANPFASTSNVAFAGNGTTKSPSPFDRQKPSDKAESKKDVAVKTGPFAQFGGVVKQAPKKDESQNVSFGGSASGPTPSSGTGPTSKVGPSLTSDRPSLIDEMDSVIATRGISDAMKKESADKAAKFDKFGSGSAGIQSFIEKDADSSDASRKSPIILPAAGNVAAEASAGGIGNGKDEASSQKKLTTGGSAAGEKEKSREGPILLGAPKSKADPGPSPALATNPFDRVGSKDVLSSSGSSVPIASKQDKVSPAQKANPFDQFASSPRSSTVSGPNPFDQFAQPKSSVGGPSLPSFGAKPKNDGKQTTNPFDRFGSGTAKPTKSNIPPAQPLQDSEKAQSIGSSEQKSKSSSSPFQNIAEALSPKDEGIIDEVKQVARQQQEAQSVKVNDGVPSFAENKREEARKAYANAERLGQSKSNYEMQNGNMNGRSSAYVTPSQTQQQQEKYPAGYAAGARLSDFSDIYSSSSRKTPSYQQQRVAPMAPPAVAPVEQMQSMPRSKVSPTQQQYPAGNAAGARLNGFSEMYSSSSRKTPSYQPRQAVAPAEQVQSMPRSKVSPTSSSEASQSTQQQYPAGSAAGARLSDFSEMYNGAPKQMSTTTTMAAVRSRERVNSNPMPTTTSSRQPQRLQVPSGNVAEGWERVEIQWKVGGRHFASTDRKRLSSPKELALGENGFSLQLHLDGQGVAVSLSLENIQTNMRMRNLKVYVYCYDGLEPVVAHAADLERSAGETEVELLVPSNGLRTISTGLSSFTFTNRDGQVAEATRQMLYDQASRDVLRVYATFDVAPL